MCARIHIYTHTHAHTYTYTHTHAHTHTHARVVIPSGKYYPGLERGQMAIHGYASTLNRVTTKNQQLDFTKDGVIVIGEVATVTLRVAY